METAALGALILAGGRNRRMSGDPKALLTDGAGIRFLDRLAAAFEDFEEKLLSTNEPLPAQGTGFTPVADRVPGQGPLGGLAAALTVCRSGGLVTAACDMPLFSKELAGYLASYADRGWGAWAVADRGGRLHPLCGVYTKACLPAIQAALAGGEHRVGMLFRALDGRVLSLADTPFGDELLCNINTPQELSAIRSRWNGPA